MSNLYCPNCSHLIGTLEPSATPLDDALDRKVAAFAEELDWSAPNASGNLYESYRIATGDTVTSHRRWSRSMQRVGYTRTRGANGVRLFVRQ